MATPSEQVAAPQEQAAAPPPPPPAPAVVAAEASVSSGVASLTRLLAELRLEHVQKSLWRGKSHQAVRFNLSLSHCTATLDAQQTAAAVMKLPWADVLGAHVLSTDGEHLAAPVALETVKKDGEYLLGVFACPNTTRNPEAMHKRHLSEFFFRFKGAQMATVLELQRYMNFLADPRSQQAVEKASSVDEISPVPHPTRKFLVLINPVGGAGRGVQTYESRVAPVLRFANVETEVKLTEHANHALEMMMEMPLGAYDCVVAVGGDGSLYEIVQGLMKRPDWNEAIRQPIGIIPSGSGNGLAHSIAHQSQEKGKAVNAAFILAKGLPHDLDITSVRNGKETTYSFLSLEWASIADVDISSEKLRALGGMRFTVAYVNQLLFQRPEYPGTIWYLEEEESVEAGEGPPHYFDTHDAKSTERPTMDLFDGEDQGPHASVKGKWKELTGHFRIVWIMNVTHAASDAFMAPGAEFDDGYNYITVMSGEHSRKDLLAMLVAIETGSHMGKKGVQQLRTRAFKLQPERPDDLICVDGELMDGPFIEAQVHRGLARIMVVPRWQPRDDK